MVHSHATKFSTSIECEHYFDIGTVQQTYTLYVNKGNLENYCKELIKVLCPIIWNEIPMEIQDAGTLPTFKFHLKNYYIGKYIC